MEPCTASCEHVRMRLARARALAAALALSPLRALPQETVERLIADAVILDVPRGGVPQRQGDEAPAPGVDAVRSLYWALRGGGGKFGVVTRFTFALHPVENVLAGMVLYPTRAGAILRFFRELTATAADDLTAL